jgi:hypothetical protein
MTPGRTARRLVRLARRPASELRLLAAAGALLAGARLALWLLPFSVVQRTAARLERPRAGPPVDPDATRERDAERRVVWAVEAMSRYVPGSRNCLVRALAGKVLLGRRGAPARLRFGVRRDEEGALRAHAWVEGRDRILIGGERGLPRYVPLVPFERAER